MDWFLWLSKTGLEPSLVYQYGLVFSHNELEEEDMYYFNHEFLQSMGISIAKHRLEILKLATKYKKVSSNTPLRPISRLLVAIKRTKKCVTQYIRTWIRHEDKALVIVPRPSYSLLKRNNKRFIMADKQGRLLLTNGSNSPMVVSMATPRNNSFSSPTVYDLRNEEKINDGDDDGGYWSTTTTGIKEFRWDTMFQDLKPT